MTKGKNIMALRSSRKYLAAGLSCIVLLISAGCSSTPKSSNSGTSGGLKTVNIGVLTDLSGPAAGEFASAANGIKAGVGVAATEGYKINYVLGDTTTSPSGALSAAQKMVEEDHVSAVIAISALTFSAANYLTAQGIPVVGAAIDGSEWLSPKSFNMFSVIGNQDFTKVTTTTGLFMKMEGVTNLGSVGYSVSPSSAAAARAAAVSVEAQGIQAGYVNDSFPFGSTNVQPVALAMKSAGVNGIVVDTDSNTVFALVAALKQVGVSLKVALLPTGGGGDLLNAGQTAIQAAQGDYFLSYFEPVEMHTTATEQMANALAKYAGIHNDPTFAEYLAYLSVLGLVQGLQGDGGNVSSSALIKSLANITDYTASGLWGGIQSVDWGTRPMGSKSCYWMTQFSGTTFHLVPGADPVCGYIIPGKSV
jgi:ABC-type branched-subunit amino acid transport system substrate-binding protein